MILFFFVFSTLVASPEVFYFGRRRAVPIFLQPLSAVVEYVGAWRRARWLFFKPYRAWQARKRAFERMGWAFDPEAKVEFASRGVSFSGGVTLRPCKCPWHVARREWRKARAFIIKHWRPVIAIVVAVTLLPFMSFYAVGVLGAAFTSKASGNWTAVGQTTWNEVGAPGAGDNATIQAGHTVTLDASSPITNYTVATTGVLALGANTLTHSGTASVTGSVTVTTGGTVENGAVTVNSGGAYGSNTAWVRDQNADFTLAAGGTFNAPNATGTWNSSANCSLAGTFNHDSGTLTFDGGAEKGAQTSATSQTFNNITRTGAGVYNLINVSGTFTMTYQGAITNSNAAGYMRLFGSGGGAATITVVMGTTSAAGQFINNNTMYLQYQNAAVAITLTIKPASSAFPWTWTGNAWTENVGNSTTALLNFDEGSVTPAITTGTGKVETYTSRGMTWSGAAVNSLGDTWLSISSTYQGAITATGTFASVNHNRINGLFVYGKAGQIKLSTLNDPQYCPKNGGAVYCLNGELYVDRGPYNETLAPTSAPVYRYILSDIAHHANANVYVADGIQVRLPRGWNRTDTGVLGGSRKNVAFRCVFGYGFEGETNGADPLLGTTTEGAGGGAINVSTSNPDTGLNAMDINEPAAASGRTGWVSPALQVSVGLGIWRASVYTDSTMAGASIIEEVNLAVDDNDDQIGISQIAFRYDSGNTRYSIMTYNGSAWVDFATRIAYVASTRYEIVSKFNIPARAALIAVNGVVADVATLNRVASKIIVTQFWIDVEASADGRIYLDNLIVCNLDVDTVAKSQSGGFAGSQRLPVIDVPAGVIA